MSLEVFVANATDVPNVETVGKSDPYTIVEFQGVFTNYNITNLTVRLPYNMYSCVSYII